MIVTFGYYNDTYFGATIEGTEFDRLNLRAEDDIIMISNKDLTLIEEWESDFLKKAICSQIEYYSINGESYNEKEPAAEDIGSYSYSDSKSNKSTLAPRAINYLNYTNLLYRG